jgi:hypothetical protein
MSISEILNLLKGENILDLSLQNESEVLDNNYAHI